VRMMTSTLVTNLYDDAKYSFLVRHMEGLQFRYISFQYYYYYYYAAFNAPCVGHKADDSHARGHVDLRVAVSVIKRFKFLFESICSDVQVASDDVR